MVPDWMVADWMVARGAVIALALGAGCGPPEARNEVLHRDVVAESLDSTYTLSIYIPPELEGVSGAPWLLVLDGEYGHIEADISDQLIAGGQAAPHVMIGIGNADLRDRDYTPTEISDEPSGGLDDFVGWLRDDLIPELEAELDIGGAPALRGLHGHSYGGLATTIALLTYPDLWSRFGATSPSLYWDGAMVFGVEEAFASENDDLPMRLYCSMGELEAPAMNPLFEEFTERLDRRGYPGLEMKAEVIDNHDHFSSWEVAYERLVPHLFPPGEAMR